MITQLICEHNTELLGKFKVEQLTNSNRTIISRKMPETVVIVKRTLIL